MRGRPGRAGPTARHERHGLRPRRWCPARGAVRGTGTGCVLWDRGTICGTGRGRAPFDNSAPLGGGGGGQQRGKPGGSAQQQPSTDPPPQPPAQPPARQPLGPATAATTPQEEHRPQRPSERSDPTQPAKGRAGDGPGPRKETATRRNATPPTAPLKGPPGGGGGGGGAKRHFGGGGGGGPGGAHSGGGGVQSLFGARGIPQGVRGIDSVRLRVDGRSVGP